MCTTELVELRDIEDNKFLCAVIAARYKDKWVFVREKGSNTWELPGGTREKNESIIKTASRELFEETGAKSFGLAPICITSVTINGKQSLGKLFYAEISDLEGLPYSEIEEIKLFETLPANLTYPLIHNVLFDKAVEFHNNFKK